MCWILNQYLKISLRHYTVKRSSSLLVLKVSLADSLLLVNVKLKQGGTD